MKQTIFFDLEEVATEKFLRNTGEYLRLSSWEKTHEIPEVVSHWEQELNEDYFDIHLPEALSIKDYTLRIVEAIEQIAKYEKRSKLEIFESIAQLGSDKIRVKVIHEDTKQGLIPLSAGVQLHKNVQELIQSASLSTIKKKKYFQGARDSETLSLMDSTMLAQSTVGSYIVNVVVPIPEEQLDDLVEVLAFPRAVSQTLANSLDSLHKFVNERSNRASQLLESVDVGVSANMCDALAAISGEECVRDFTVTIEYSKLVNKLEETISNYTFQAKDAGTLREASKILKGEYVKNDFSDFGLIKRLDRDAGHEAGEVMIVVELDGRPRSVKVNLDAEQYSDAIRAHEQKIYVAFKGDLKVTPRSAIITNLKTFRILDNEDLFSSEDDE